MFDFQFHQKRMMQQIKLTISSLVVAVPGSSGVYDHGTESMQTLQVTYPYRLKLDIIMRQLSQVKLTWSLKMGMEAFSCLLMKSPEKMTQIDLARLMDLLNQKLTFTSTFTIINIIP